MAGEDATDLCHGRWKAELVVCSSLLLKELEFGRGCDAQEFNLLNAQVYDFDYTF